MMNGSGQHEQFNYQQPPQGGPFCRQCDQRHPWGQHVDPICARCHARGHVVRDCPTRQHLN